MQPQSLSQYLRSLSQHKTYLVLHKEQLFGVLVPSEDYERIAKHSWHIHRSAGKGRDKGEPYARATIKGKKVYMHRFILGVTDKGKQVDHKNHNTLDNRRENLEVVDAKTNQRRRRDREGRE